ncbi:VCBS domain-containing protein, partial [Marinobacterium nitratireducens]|uniref:VCBS domain-containing protein n=1 Tax=Marinobacterium nitratireducens TaxID=518897 RepID=UPI00166A8ADF
MANHAPQIDSITAQGTREDAQVLHGHVTATDTDSGDHLTISASTPVAGFQIAPDGHYTFDPSHAAYQHLAEGQQLILQIPITATDSQGATDTRDLVLVLTGTNDTPDLGQLPAIARHEDDRAFTGQITATDADSGEQLSFSLAAPVSGFSLDPDGHYRFDPSHPDYQQLPEGQQLQLTLGITVTDSQGTTDTRDLVITLTGTNDHPVLQRPPILQPHEDDPLVHGRLAATDVDSGDRLSFSNPSPVAGFSLAPDGQYSFDPAHSAYQHLAAGEQKILTIPVTVTDSQGATDAHDLIIVVTGTNDSPVLKGVPALRFDEGDPLFHGQLRGFDIDSGDRLSYSIQSQVPGLTLNSDGSYSFDPGHGAYQHLVAGQQQTLTIPVTVTDGQGATDSRDLVITLTGTNDHPVMGKIPALKLHEDDKAFHGQLQATDADTGAHLGYSMAAPVQGLTLNSDGSYSFDPSHAAYQHLAAGQRQTLSVPITVTDEHGASDTRNLVIHLTGTNDLPVLRQVPAMQLHEDDRVIHGQLQATDPDTGDSLHYAQTAPVPGFSLLPDGSYTFDPSHPDYQSLAAGEPRDITVPVTVTDSQGGTSASLLVFHLTGTNDMPVVNAVPVVSATEDGHTVSGTLTGTDIDSGDTLTYSIASPVPGLTLNTDGSWTFDPTDAAYQSLAEGQPHQIIVPVTGTDSQG